MSTATLAVALHNRPERRLRGTDIQPTSTDGQTLQLAADLMDEIAGQLVFNQLAVSKLRGMADKCRRDALGVESEQ